MHFFCTEHLKIYFEENWSLIKLALIIIIITLGIRYARKWIQGRRCTTKLQLNGKTVIVTGSNIGIGKESARDFFKRGARVILACRNVEKAEEAAKDIKSTTRKSSGTLVVRQLDLANFNSIREFAKNILETEDKIDILVNNAGLMTIKNTTVDNFDLVFQSNHLGHFLLTNLLLDKIKNSAPSRIVNVSSIGHYFSSMHWNDLNLNEKGAYNPWKAYCQSKLANILFTKELARRLEGTDVTVYALHPGAVHTGFIRYCPDYLPAILCVVGRALVRTLYRTAEQGAQTTIHCAVCEKCANQTGLYYDDCKETKPSKAARDEASAIKLWDVSAEMVKLDDELNAFKMK